MNKSLPCDQQAFPHSKSTKDPWGNLFVEATMGLTKRELFAAMAMQGYCMQAAEHDWSLSEVAADAVAQADALLTALENVK